MARVYSFKSTGIDFGEKELTREELEVKIGIKTPIEMGDNEIFKMHSSLITQISDNLRNLILTNPGERMGRHNFGSGVRELTMEYAATDFNEKAMMKISSAVKKFMPFISLKTFTSEVNENRVPGIANITMKITYDIPTIKETDCLVEVTYYVAG